MKPETVLDIALLVVWCLVAALAAVIVLALLEGRMNG